MRASSAMARARLHTFRVASVVLALLWALAPAAAALHSETHSHVYCAEHGSVEDASATRSDSTRGEAGLTSFAEEQLHQACGFVALWTRAVGMPGQPLALAHEANVFSANGVEPADGSDGGIDVLHRAPKASPPNV